MKDYSSFTEAITAAQAGDQDAFAWLYEKTSREKYYIAIKYMKNQTEAADVLQEAYMKAWQKLGTLQEPEKFPGWIGQIVANEALLALRKKKPLNFSDVSAENDEGEEFVYDLKDEAIDRQPELNYTANERQEIIRSMIDSLSDEQRLCVMMYYVEEMPVKEIAETLGCSENTVKSRLNYGRKNIKAEAEELKKKGYSFYSVAPIPLLLLLLRAELATASGVTAAAGGALAGAGVATGAAAGYASAGTAGATATGSSVAAGTGTAGSAAAAGGAATTGTAGGLLSTAVGKIMITLVSVIAAGGIGFGIYQAVQPSAPEPEVRTETVSEATPTPTPTVEPTPTPKPTPTPTPTPDPGESYDLYLDYLEKEETFDAKHYGRFFRDNKRWGTEYEVTGRNYGVVDMDGDRIPEVVAEARVANMSTGRENSVFNLWTVRKGKVVASKLTRWRWVMAVPNEKDAFLYSPEQNRIILMYGFGGGYDYHSFSIGSDGRADKKKSYSKKGLKKIRWVTNKEIRKAFEDHRMPTQGKYDINPYK